MVFLMEMITLDIEFTDEERILVEKYAKAHGMSLEELLRKAMFEKINKEYDAALAEAVKKKAC